MLSDSNEFILINLYSFMKILFFHTPHQQLDLISQFELEIILGHLKADDTVYMVRCQSRNVLQHCVTNHCGRQYYCRTCKLMQDKMYAIASTYDKFYLRDFLPQPNINVPDFNSVEELKSFNYKQINIGLGVASVVISLVRDHQFDTHKYAKKVKQQMLLSMQFVNTVEDMIDELKPDIVYTFNGRMSQYAAVVEYCRHYDQAFRVYEFTSRKDAYRIIDNSIPHDTQIAISDIKNKWESEPDNLRKEQIGKSFFENARRGITLLEKSFILSQQEGVLPKINPDKEVITFFNSSIDEFAAVTCWKKYVYLFEDEIDAIQQICVHFKGDQKKQFVLRIHPNLKYLHNTQIRRLDSLRNLDNLIIVEPTSNVSTYTLIDISSKIITFGSTVGVEATYFGKPSICLGLAFYNGLDVTYIPCDEKELYGWINTDNLLPKSQSDTLKYGYWVLNMGERIVHKDKTYLSSELEFGAWEKLSILLLKIFSTEILVRFYKLFSLTTYRRLKEPGFRQAIIKEFMPWKKR